MVRTNQGGSVLSFIIIGVVAVSLLVGGVYYVRQQIDASNAEPVRPEPQQAEEKQQQNPEKKSSEAPAPKDDGAQRKERQQQMAPPSASSDTDKSAELPQTGPAEFLATVAALGLLSASGVSYLRSRRPELSL